MLRLEYTDGISALISDKTILGRPRSLVACYKEDGEVADENDDLCALHTHLHTFDVSDQNLSVELSQAINTAVQSNPIFKYLNLSRTNLNERLEYILPALKSPSMNLYSLNLWKCSLGPSGLERVAETLMNMSNPIRELSLSDNQMTEASLEAFVPYFSQNRRLRLLNLADNPALTPRCLELLSIAFEESGYPIKTLILSNVGLKNDWEKQAAKLLNHPAASIELLDISWNEIYNKSVVEGYNLPAVIGQMRHLKELVCNAIKFGSRAPRLLNALCDHPNIEIIHINSGYMSDIPTGEAVSQLISTCQKLKWVEFVANFFSMELLHIVLPTISLSQTLSAISLNYNSINDDTASVIADMLTKNRSLIEVHLMINEIGDAGAESFANALTQNQTLRYLALDENMIGEQGALAIARALDVNQQVKVNLSANSFDPSQFSIPETILGRFLAEHRH